MTTSPARVVRRVTAVLATLVIAGSLAAPDAIAGGPNQADFKITLVAQDASVPVGGDLHLTLHIDGTPTPGFSVSIVAHQALESRTAFDRTLAGDNLGSVLDQVIVGLDELPVNASDDRVITLGLEGAASSRAPERLGARRPGVYPLEVELRDEQDESQGRFVSYLVATDAPGAPATISVPLDVAWVWPITAAPAIQLGGTVDPEAVAHLRPNGRLGEYAAALTAATEVPLTLAPGPETVESWANVGRENVSLGQTLSALQANAIGNHQIVNSPYVPVNIPSLLRANLGTAFDNELVEGDRALREVLGVSSDRTTAIVRELDPASLTRLRAGGVARVVVDAGAVTSRSGRGSAQQPFTLDAPADGFLPGGPVSALAADSGLARLLTTDTTPALRAQQLVAGLSIAALEQPNAQRAVAVINPDALDPQNGLLTKAIEGIRTHPWLHPVTVTDAFVRVPVEVNAQGAAVTRSLAAYEPPPPPVSQSLYDTAANRVGAFRSMGAANGDVATAQRLLLTSVSSAWTGPDAGKGRRAISAVDFTINQFLTRIHVPEPGTITLFEGAREIPITFQNDTGQVVSVLIELSSPKLAFPDGASRVVELPPRSTTISFAVEARTSGTFPLDLNVRSADGALTIASGSFQIRSRAVSLVGLLLMGGAGIFLALWWGLHHRRRRRRSVAGALTA